MGIVTVRKGSDLLVSTNIKNVIVKDASARESGGICCLWLHSGTLLCTTFPCGFLGSCWEMLYRQGSFVKNDGFFWSVHFFCLILQPL